MTIGPLGTKEIVNKLTGINVRTSRFYARNILIKRAYFLRLVLRALENGIIGKLVVYDFGAIANRFRGTFC